MKSNKRKPTKLKRFNGVFLRCFILLAVLLTVLVEVFCYFILRGTFYSNAREKLIDAGNGVVGYLATGVHSDRDITLYLYSYLDDGLNVYIIDGEGNLILPLDENELGVQIDDTDAVLGKLGSVNFGEAIVFKNDSRLVYASPVFIQGGTGECYLVVSYSLSVMQKATGVSIMYFILIGLMVLMLASAASITISQKLTSGIRNLSATAVQFSKGDYTVNFANADYQELADLSDTLNSVRDEVKKSGDFQRELLANVTHDLKTPLTMIKAYASMIREISGGDPEKREKHLQVIIDEADRLTGLVNDVLSVSKVSSNLDEVTPKIFNLTEFLYSIINKFSYLQETQGYNLMVDIDADVYTRADEEKIGQVIYNLLGNAVNYTGEDKTVYISLKRSPLDDRIKFSVRDTGKGIAKEDIPEIWNRYYRVKETHARPVKGTGLGLSIVQIILKNHNFDFGVESELGKGSTFWIDFPEVSSKPVQQ